MKQTIKRLSALLLAMAMALCLLSANVWAAEEAEEDVSVPSAGDSVDADAGNEARVEPQVDVIDSGVAGDKTEYKLDTNGHLEIWLSSSGYGTVTKQFTDPRIKSVTLRGVSEIGDKAFNCCTSIESLNLGSSLRRIGEAAFNGCTGLKGLLSEGAQYVPIYCPSTLEIIDDSAFSGCTSLNRIVFNDGLKSIGWRAFAECTRLDHVTLPTSLENLDRGAFNGCTGLKSLIIQEGKLRGISAEAEDEAIFKGAELQGMHSYVFENCTSLSDVTMTGALEVIPARTFAGCTNLRYMLIRSGTKEICISAFENCTKLETVEFPDTLQEIGFSAFQNCLLLKSVSIPDSVTFIGGWALGFKDRATETKVDSFTIEGNSGTTAEAYANENGFKFVDLSVVPRSGFTRTENKKKGVITCYWNKQVGGSGYELQCSTDKNFKKNVTRMSIPYMTTVTRGFTGLKKGTYYVRIRTISKTGGRYSEWSGASKVKVTKGYDLSMPELSSVKPGKKGEFTAKWKRNIEGRGYQVQYCSVKTFKKNVKSATFFRNSVVRFNPKKLKKGWYFVRIRTIKGKKTSAWCKAKSVLVS